VLPGGARILWGGGVLAPSPVVSTPPLPRLPTGEADGRGAPRLSRLGRATKLCVQRSEELLTRVLGARLCGAGRIRVRAVIYNGHEQSRARRCSP